MALSEAEVDELLGGAHVAVLGTVDARGRPHQVPIWYGWKDGAALMLTDRASQKWRNLLARPHASLCIDTKDPPYRGAILRGEVEEASDEDYRALLHEFAIHYLGQQGGDEYAASSSTGDPATSVAFRLKPSRTISWGD
jgi:PPOX class probable F420-dependent enzyme